jgi:hypothetical protein
LVLGRSAIQGLEARAASRLAAQRHAPPVLGAPLREFAALKLCSARRSAHTLRDFNRCSETRLRGPVTARSRPQGFRTLRLYRTASPCASRRLLAIVMLPARKYSRMHANSSAAPPFAVRIRAGALRSRSEEIIGCRHLIGKAQVAPAGSADKRFLSASPVSHAACYLLRRQPPRLPGSRPTLNITEVM